MPRARTTQKLAALLRNRCCIAEENGAIQAVRSKSELANEALNVLGLPDLVEGSDIEVIASKDADYGYADDAIKEGIHLIATHEGLIADPVHEGRAIRGFLDLSASNRSRPEEKILLMQLGGSPAIHA